MNATKNCRRCGVAEITTAYEDVPYMALPEVFLNVPVHRCPKCGYHEVEITQLEQLNKLIAEMVLEQPKLTGPQLRFLRKYIGCAAEDFAMLVGITEQDVKRWENGQDIIPAHFERLLRLLAMHGVHVEEYPAEQPEPAKQVDVVEQKPRKLRAATNGWGWSDPHMAHA